MKVSTREVSIIEQGKQGREAHTKRSVNQRFSFDMLKWDILSVHINAQRRRRQLEERVRL